MCLYLGIEFKHIHVPTLKVTLKSYRYMMKVKKMNSNDHGLEFETIDVYEVPLILV